MSPVVVTVQMEFRGGPLEGTCRHALVVPERMWFAPAAWSGWMRVDLGDDTPPDPPWDGQVEYRLSAGPIGGIAIYRLAAS